MDAYFLKRRGTFSNPVVITLDREKVDLGSENVSFLRNGSKVSWNHATFYSTSCGQWLVGDHKSSYGVFLNGAKIGSGLHLVKCGDIIGLGAASGDSEQDYVFIFCSYSDHTSSGASAHVFSKDERSSSHSTLISTPRSIGPDIVSNHFSAVHVKQEKTETNDNTETISQPSVIKQEKLDPAIDEPDDKRAAGRAQNLHDSSLHSPAVDIKSNHCENALILPRGVSEASSSCALTDIQERNNLPLPESISQEEEKWDVEQVLQLKQLKIVVPKYDDILIETYNVEKRDTENDVETTASDKIAPCKRRRRIRIDSSSDESENDCEVQQSQKCISLESPSLKSCAPQSSTSVSCKHSYSDEIVSPKQLSHRSWIDSSHSETNSRTHQKWSFKFQSKSNKAVIDNNIQKTVCAVSPIIKSCAAENTTYAFNNSAPSSQCYTREDEVIVISSDDDDYVNNQFSVKIKTEPAQDEDLSNSEWHYVSSSQESYEQRIKHETHFDLETSKSTSNDVPVSNTLRDCSSRETKMIPNECLSGTDVCADDAKVTETFDWDHNEEPNDSGGNEDNLNSPENTGNSTKILSSTDNIFSIKIKTEPAQDEDLSNIDWHYVSSSQELDEQHIKHEGHFDLEISKGISNDVPVSHSVHDCSSHETNRIPKECISGIDEYADDANEIETFEWDHNEKPNDSSSNEDDLNSSQNAENSKKLFDRTDSNCVLPKTYSGDSKLVASPKNKDDFFPSCLESLFSDENSDCDQSEFEHDNKIEKHFSERNKKPVVSVNKSRFSGNDKKSLSCKISKKSFPSNLGSFVQKDPKFIENKKKLIQQTNRKFTSESGNSSESKNFTFSRSSEKHTCSVFSKKTYSSEINELLFPENDAHFCFYENHIAHPHEELVKESSSRKNTEIVVRHINKRQKEKPVNRTLFTEPLPVSYRLRKQHVRDPCQKDKIIVDKDAQKREKSQSCYSDTSKNKVQKATANKSVLPPAKKKESKYEATTKGKKIKNSSKPSLRTQMQNKYNPIPFRITPSPAVVPSSNKQTCQSTKQANISLARKRKASTLSDDALEVPVKAPTLPDNALEVPVKAPTLPDNALVEVHVKDPILTYNIPVLPSKERKAPNIEHLKSSRMSILTYPAVENDIDHLSTNIGTLRNRNVSEGLTDKLCKNNPTSNSGQDKNSGVCIQNKDSTEQSVICQNGQNQNNAEISGACSPKTGSTGSHSSIHRCQSVLEYHSSAVRSSVSHPSDLHYLGYRSHVPRTNSVDLHDNLQMPQQSFLTTSSETSQELDPQCISGPSFLTTNSSASSSFEYYALRKNPTAAHCPVAQTQMTSQASGSVSNSPASHKFNPRIFNGSPNVKHSSVSCGATGNFTASSPNPAAQRIAMVVPQKSTLTGHDKINCEVSLTCRSAVKLDQHTFILKILNWMPAWLWEQQNIHNLPPVVDWTRIRPLKLSYESADDYVSSFYNLLLIEMWEWLSQKWKKTQQLSEFSFIVISSVESGEVLSLNCVALFSVGMTLDLVEGTLLIIHFKVEGNRHTKLFAYVSMCKFENNPGISGLHQELRKLPSAMQESAKICKFTLQTKKKKFSICKGKLTKANLFVYIAPQVRVVNSLISIQSSLLIKDILCPQEKNCTVPHAVHTNMPILGRFSKKQTSAIIAISDEMRKVYSVPRILLLQGPPGTEKAHVIIGIIQHLLSKKHEKIKILVTAPSNAAVDEIGRRLIQLRNKQNECKIPPLCFVRVGIPKQIHPDVNKFSVDSLIHSSLRKKWRADIENAEATLFEKQAKINSLNQEIESMKLSKVHPAVVAPKLYELERNERRVARNEDDLLKLKNVTVDENSPAYYETKLSILKNADVVLSTLSSCRQGILETAFGKKSDVHFTCCIIDEASRCTEPEVLQPLAYGVCKLLLVGDHQQQLATVHSRVCAQNHLEKSLFERIHLHFKSTLGRSPVFMLTEQYRMHAEICSFPSRHFYSELLETPPEVNKKYKNFPLKPYFFLNIPYCEESRTYVLETEIIIRLCLGLSYVCPRDCSIGVITPYQGHKSIYEKTFSRHPDCRKIDVNTVNSYQGREKDVIVMSCVRAHSPHGNNGFLPFQKWLNVAITRASKCFIMCGHASSLEQQYDWNALISDAKQRNVLISVTSANEVPLILERMRNKF